MVGEGLCGVFGMQVSRFCFSVGFDYGVIDPTIEEGDKSRRNEKKKP